MRVDHGSGEVTVRLEEGEVGGRAGVRDGFDATGRGEGLEDLSAAGVVPHGGIEDGGRAEAGERFGDVARDSSRSLQAGSGVGGFREEFRFGGGGDVQNGSCKTNVIVFW